MPPARKNASASKALMRKPQSAAKGRGRLMKIKTKLKAGAYLSITLSGGQGTSSITTPQQTSAAKQPESSSP